MGPAPATPPPISGLPRAPYALVLAAGAGSRFGGGKLLAPLEGKPLVQHVATTLASGIAAGVLAGGVGVLPPGDTRIAWHLDAAGLDLIENPEAASGVASSIGRGLAALEDPALSPPAGAALIILADQPRLRLEVVRRLIAAWRQSGRSVRPRYAATPDEPGHPVLLDRSLWSLARAIGGDQGLGALLRQQAGSVRIIDVPGANPDVDTREDLLQLEGRQE